MDLITNFAKMSVPEHLVVAYSPDSDVFAGIWCDIVDAAERRNEPGLFTAFIGYE
jgi:hypothetical protein